MQDLEMFQGRNKGSNNYKIPGRTSSKSAETAKQKEERRKKRRPEEQEGMPQHRHCPPAQQDTTKIKKGRTRRNILQGVYVRVYIYIPSNRILHEIVPFRRFLGNVRRQFM
jgi:hypothetical protein